MRFGVLNAVSDTVTPFQTPFNTVFDNYAPHCAGPASGSARRPPRPSHMREATALRCRQRHGVPRARGEPQRALAGLAERGGALSGDQLLDPRIHRYLGAHEGAAENTSGSASGWEDDVYGVPPVSLLSGSSMPSASATARVFRCLCSHTPLGISMFHGV